MLWSIDFHYADGPVWCMVTQAKSRKSAIEILKKHHAADVEIDEIEPCGAFVSFLIAENPTTYKRVKP